MQNKSLFSRFLTNKKVLFIVSVVLAFIFWILTADNITKTFNEIPVKFSLPESVSQELEIFSSSDDYVSVTVDGKRVAVDALSSDSFNAYIDLSDVNEAGEKSFDVKIKSNQNLNIDVTKIEPENITLMIDKPMTKTVELKYDFSYSPEGYYVENNVPETVEVSGPQSFVEKVKSAYIGGSVTSKDATSVTNNYKITLYDHENPTDPEAKIINNEYITLSYDNVDVTFSYYIIKENIPFEVVCSEGVIIPDTYYQVTPDNLSLAIPDSLLDEDGNYDVLPIDIGRLAQCKNEIYNLTFSVKEVVSDKMLNKTDGVENISLRLDFSSLSTKTIQVPSSRCRAENLPDGFNYNKPETFSIVVFGTKSALATLDPEKVDIIIDFADVTASEAKYVDVPVTINLNVDDLCWAYRRSQTSSVLLIAE